MRPGPRPPGRGIWRSRDDEIFEERVHRLPDRGARGPLLWLDLAAADEGVNLALAYLKRQTKHPILAPLTAAPHALRRGQGWKLCGLGGRCWRRWRGVGHRGLSLWAGSRQFYHGRTKHARFLGHARRIELDPDLQVLLHDVSDRNRRGDLIAPNPLKVRKQRLGIAFDLFFPREGNLHRHTFVILHLHQSLGGQSLPSEPAERVGRFPRPIFSARCCTISRDTIHHSREMLWTLGITASMHQNRVLPNLKMRRLNNRGADWSFASKAAVSGKLVILDLISSETDFPGR